MQLDEQHFKGCPAYGSKSGWFTVTEANLYLDTHPCDSQAIAYLKQMSQAYADARNAYEAQYGPLRAENAKDTVYWSWTDDPWPWEGGGY